MISAKQRVRDGRRTCSLPQVNRNESGPSQWHRVRRSELFAVKPARQLVLNIPAQLLCRNEEEDLNGAPDSLISRLCCNDRPTGSFTRLLDQPPPGEDCGASDRLQDRQQAHAIGALLNMLAAGNLPPAKKKDRVPRHGQHAEWVWSAHTSAEGYSSNTTPENHSFFFSVEALRRRRRPKEQEGAEDGGELVGLSVRKHIMASNYSDSLSFDRSMRQAEDMWKKVHIKRVANALEGSKHLPSNANLAVTSRNELFRVYKKYGSLRPLVPDWNTHFALARSRTGSGGDPFACGLSERPQQWHLHLLAPELLLDPFHTPAAYSAGLAADNDSLEVSAAWILEPGESPARSQLPPLLGKLIDRAAASVALAAVESSSRGSSKCKRLAKRQRKSRKDDEPESKLTKADD